MECELIPLFSSSSGNATLVCCGDQSVLVDCGVSFTMLKKSMETFNKRLGDIKAVFITHEHYDHVKGLGQLAKQISAPIYATEGTIRALPAVARGAFVKPIEGKATAGRFCLTPEPTSHDAAQSVCYHIEVQNKHAAIVTDTGEITPGILSCMQGCDLVMLESNHDVKMLMSGPYPQFLKERIRSARGHLSNDDCALNLAALALKGLKKAVLAHISAKNNTPLIAKAATTAALNMYGVPVGPGGLELFAAGSRAAILNF